MGKSNDTTRKKVSCNKIFCCNNFHIIVINFYHNESYSWQTVVIISFCNKICCCNKYNIYCNEIFVVIIPFIVMTIRCDKILLQPFCCNKIIHKLIRYCLNHFIVIELNSYLLPRLFCFNKILLQLFCCNKVLQKLIFIYCHDYFVVIRHYQ